MQVSLVSSNESCPLDGITIKAIADFIEDHGGKEAFEGKTTTDVNNLIQKPLTQELKVSYCKYLKIKKKSTIKEANVFISHAWQYQFLDVVEAITEHFNNDDDTYIWFDVFTVNQHTNITNSEWWAESFRSAIEKIGRTVVVLSPWNSPIPFTRAWCLWEIYCTIVSGKKLEFAMCSKEKQAFFEWHHPGA